MSANGYDVNHNWKPDFDFNTLYFAAYAVFCAGISVGLSNVTSGWVLFEEVKCSLSVGICGSSCALSDAQDGGLFSKMLIAQIFASALGIYGIIVGIIVSNMGSFPK